MQNIIRTTSDHPDFIKLVSKLDYYLHQVDGNEHSFYAQYNKIDLLKNVVVLYIDNIPLACGAFKEFNNTTVEVKRMWTEEVNRGKGIASAVLNELEVWAKELGYSNCILETGKRMPDAVKLYSSRGYHLTENYGQYIGVENSVCFSKQLIV